MLQLPCEVSEGLRPAEATVRITDENNRGHFLPVDRELLNEEGGRYYLPVTLVHVDERKKRALVGLPIETDSGYNRLWVRQKQLVVSETDE
jgi:hypothetical protein